MRSPIRLSPPDCLPPSRAFVRGFSLIEMIGVLAILAVSAAILTPNVAHRISRLRAEREERTLATIGEAVVRSVTANQVIPGASSWIKRAASVTGLSLNEVMYSVPSDKTTARVYLIDPSFAPRDKSLSISDPVMDYPVERYPIDTTMAVASESLSVADSISVVDPVYTLGFGDPLWTQSVSGTRGITSWANARVMLVSVHKPGLALPIKSGPAASAALFEELWNWTFDATTKAPPSGWPAAWNQNGQYLHVYRINFAPLFIRVTFSNLQYPDLVPYLQVGTGPATPFDWASTMDTHYLQGTMIRLLAAGDEDTTSRGPLQLSHALQRSGNFLYADDQWQIP